MSLKAINERYMIEKRSPALLTVLGCGISSIVHYQPWQVAAILFNWDRLL